MSMKKYKIALGACGPQILCTNIIKAHSAEEAVRKYLEETKSEVTDAKVKHLLSSTYEYVSDTYGVEDEKDIVDVHGRQIMVNCRVALINAPEKHRTQVNLGVVSEIRKTSIQVVLDDGRSVKVMIPSTGEIIKCVIIDRVEEKNDNNTPCDAIGQPVRPGDYAVAMMPAVMGNVKGFELFGTIAKVSETYAWPVITDNAATTSRKMLNRLVVIRAAKNR